MFCDIALCVKSSPVLPNRFSATAAVHDQKGLLRQHADACLAHFAVTYSNIIVPPFAETDPDPSTPSPPHYCIQHANAVRTRD